MTMDMNKQQQRIEEGALLYALADKSDPFAYSRAVCHSRNGVASAKDDHYYSAEAYKDTKTAADGSQYTVTAYKSMRRP